MKNLDKQRNLYWAIFIVVIIVCWLGLSGEIGSWIQSLNEPQLTLQITHPNAELSLDPQTKTLKVGDDLSANIILNTGSKPVDGVDIYSLHYDPSILKVVDDSATQKGTQITPGTIMAVNAANTVDEKSGMIKFGQVAGGGKAFSGKGVLATIHFKALSAGTSYLKFDFRLGSTIDSNAAYKGKDQLTKVVDAIYTVAPVFK